jgi:glycosyltransferase involved in cell wall biosynthesis
MVTFNDVQHVPAAISQFYNVVDDIVVVDGGSVDGTVSWCEKLGVRVIHHPFNDDFSAQKNLAIDALDAEWVYFHNPAERLELPLLDIMERLADCDEGQASLQASAILRESDQKFDCFGLPCKTYINGVQIDSYPDYQYRLFRNYCRFEKPIREEIVNFKNRTEVDFKRVSAEKHSRFNIRHYKSSDQQKEQDVLLERIERELKNANE